MVSVNALLHRVAKVNTAFHKTISKDAYIYLAAFIATWNCSSFIVSAPLGVLFFGGFVAGGD